jgi:hypothetical protein
VVPAATEQREGRGDLRRQSGGVRVFSRRQSGPVSAFLSCGVPERTPGGRECTVLSGRMKGQIRGENEEPGTWLGRITLFGCKKTVVGGLVGETAGDALTSLDNKDKGN